MGEDRSGLTDVVEPRSPVIPGPEDDVPDELMVDGSGSADSGSADSGDSEG